MPTQTDAPPAVLSEAQEREIIDDVNDIITETGFGELVIEIKWGKISLIKSIYRKSKIPSDNA
jgi:hypothetical protein